MLTRIWQKDNRLRLPLLLVAVLVFLGSSSNCNVYMFPDVAVSSPLTKLQPGEEPPFIASMKRDLSFDTAPGSQTVRYLAVKGTGSNLTFKWTPPPGATDFEFDPQPEPGGPPFIWKNRSTADEGIAVEFRYPSLPPGHSTAQVIDTLEVWNADRTFGSGAVFKTEIKKESLLSSEPPVAETEPAPSTHRPTTATGGDLWSIGEAMDIYGITLTTELCQDWLSTLQNGSTFFALRTPVSPTTAITQAAPLPIVFGGLYSNTLRLVNYSPYGSVLTFSLELRPERFTFLENALPTAPEEQWLALGVTSEPITCPQNLELLPDTWGWESQFLLDLTYRPDNCLGCALPLYYCYESETPPPPPIAGSLWQTLARTTANGLSYQGEGITCLGPRILTLHSYPFAWELLGTTSRWITPTQVITLHHYLNNYSGSPISFTLDYTSDLGVEWNLYGGDWGPDLSDPLTSPLIVNSFQNLWFVSQAVPTDTASGPYALLITATVTTSPTDRMATSDLLWLRDWAAPPPPACAALESVVLSGPAGGDPGVAYTFLATVSPTTATTPFTYTWQATGNGTETHTYRYITDTIQFTWNTSGTYTVAVTAANCGNKPTDSLSIVIGGGGPAWRIYLPLVLRDR